MPKLVKDDALQQQQPKGDLDVDLRSGKREAGEASTSAVRGEHIEKEALESVRGRETSDPKGLPKIFKQTKSTASQDLQNRLKDIADIEGDEKVQDQTRFTQKEQEVERQQAEVEAVRDARSEEEARKLTTKRSGNDGNEESKPKSKEGEEASVKAAQSRRDLIDQVEADEKVQDNDRFRTNQAETEKLKEQGSEPVDADGARIAGKQSGGDGGNEKPKAAERAPEQTEARIGRPNTKGTQAAQQARRDLIDQVEADEKVEDNNRIRSTQDQTAKLRDSSPTQRPSEDLTLKQGESSTDGSRKGATTTQDKSQEPSLKRPRLLKGKVLSSAGKQAQKAKLTQQLREVSEGELAEKVEDQSAKNQQQNQKQQIKQTNQQVQNQAALQGARVSGGGNNGDSSSSGTPQGGTSGTEGADEPTVGNRGTTARRGPNPKAGAAARKGPDATRGSKAAASNKAAAAQKQAGTTALQQQQNQAAAKAVKLKTEEERLAEQAIAEIDLSRPYGFQATTSAELHRDARDIRVLLVMADAYRRMKTHIEKDVLAANVAAEGAASFESANIEAVQVASDRFREQVGDVQAWQRFGAN